VSPDHVGPWTLATVNAETGRDNGRQLTDSGIEIPYDYEPTSIMASKTPEDHQQGPDGYNNTILCFALLTGLKL